MIRAYFVIVLLLNVLCSYAHCVVTSDVAGRRLTQPGVAAYGLNVDGVALIGLEFTDSDSLSDVIRICTGTLISDHHLLTAAHCFDENQDGVTDDAFGLTRIAAFESPNLGVLSIDLDPSSVQYPGEWPTAFADLAVVSLSEAAPQGIPRYAVYNGRSELGQRFVLVGYGDSGHGSEGVKAVTNSVPQKRAGLNRYETLRDDLPNAELLAYDFDSGLPANNAFELTGIPSDLGFGNHEVLLASGDSGAPAFIGSAVAGIASYSARLPASDVTDFDDSSWGEGGFDTRVSNFSEFIVQATDGQAVLVPEPDVRFTLWVGLAVFCASESRRKANQLQNGDR